MGLARLAGIGSTPGVILVELANFFVHHTLEVLLIELEILDIAEVYCEVCPCFQVPFSHRGKPGMVQSFFHSDTLLGVHGEHFR